MPNWVTNSLEIKCDSSKRLEFILSELRSDKSEFDFNKIAPMPKELESTTSPTRIISKEEYDKQEERIAKGELTDNEKNWGLSRGLSQVVHDEYIEKFGHANWYDWQYSNWGTKWNANDVYIEDNVVTFLTAWSTPYSLLVKLSMKYPDAIFSVKFSDEDFGYNVGEYTLINGEEVDSNVPDGGSKEAIELAIEIQYGDIEGFHFDEVLDDIFVSEIGNYQKNIIDIAYENNIEPTKYWSPLVLTRYKEIALEKENYELVSFIDNLNK